MKRLLVFSTLLLVFVGAASAQFVYTNVTCPDSTMKVAIIMGINDLGTMVGAYYTDADPTWHALVIKKGKCSAVAPNLLGSKSAYADGINNSGDITGAYSDGNVFVTSHGFVLEKTGVLITLDFPTADSTWAYKINESGTIVGKWVLRDALGNTLAWHGFVWKNGEFTEDMYPSSADTLTLGINSRGDRVGWWDLDPNGSALHGYLQTKKTVTSIDYPGSALSFATDISGAGVIVGQFADASGTHGYLKIGPEFTPFDYPGAALTGFEGVNNKGAMVGWWYDADFVPHGLLVERK